MTHSYIINHTAKWLKKHPQNIKVPNCTTILKELKSATESGENQNKFYEAESRTFDRTRTLIFVENEKQVCEVCKSENVTDPISEDCQNGMCNDCGFHW